MSNPEMQPAPVATPTQASEKLTPLAHVLCGWPLVMVLFGGLIGGGLGGLAYGINVGIYKSKLPVFVKAVLNPLVGGMAFILWLIVGGLIQYNLQK